MSGRNQTTRATTTIGGATGSAARSRFGCLAKPAASLAMLAIVGLLSGASPQAATAAEPDHVFAKCTFDLTLLRSALTITPADADVSATTLEASYILIYVRTNPNDGQQIGVTSTYTGPVLCHNSLSDTVVPTTETTQIPPTGTVDVLDSEEAFHLRYQLNPPPVEGPEIVEKRVCHTVAGNTDCFLIKHN